MRFLQVADDLEVDALHLRQIDLLDVDEPQQLLDRPRHFAAALVARTAALRDADLRPELLLVHAEPAPDLPGIQHAIEEFHCNSAAVKGFSVQALLYHWHMVARSARAFQGRPTGGAKIGTKCSKIATGRSASAGIKRRRDHCRTRRPPGEHSMTGDSAPVLAPRSLLQPAPLDSMLRYDLHCHSTRSDGLLAPADVVRRAAARGVDVLALTDHDEVAGLAEAREAARDAGIQFIDGVGALGDVARGHSARRGAQHRPGQRRSHRGPRRRAQRPRRARAAHRRRARAGRHSRCFRGRARLTSPASG